ncbi:hypothetical protein IAE37_003880 [Pseudomonas sp. S31]|nr:hypothetical protein [Pseudomonas sp. S31]
MAAAGRVNATHIVGQPGGWAVQVDVNHLEHVLVAQRSGNIRLFKKFETLVSYLLDLGIDHFQVDASTFDPTQQASYQRPDRAQALKRAHEAAAYEAWFIEQVEASLRDKATPMDSEDVEELFAEYRSKLEAKRR